jgi:pimeloyl-ACP methyl ester carboxylesterase
MSSGDVTVVLAHGAWADGSSWAKVIAPLASQGIKAVAAPLPLTSFAEDVAALDRTLERVTGPVVLVAHAYAGAVIAGTRDEKVKALVYISALAPDEGESVADAFYRAKPHPKAPTLAPDNHGLIYLPHDAFAAAFAPNATAEEQTVLEAVQHPISPTCITVPVPRPLWKDRPSWFLVAEQDRMILEETQRFMAARMKAQVRSHPVDHIPIVTAPAAVVDIIREATAAVRGSNFSPNRMKMNMTTITYRTVDVDGFKIFCREAGQPDGPKLLLLHGFPTASHMFRDLIPLLSDRFHIVAPDLPGFGNSDMPAKDHTFARIADTIDRFTEIVGFDRYAVYVFDYGAPTGFRLAVKHPDRITAIISQNGNAYEEGLSDGWKPIRAYWENPSPANREALRAFLKPETTVWQYTHGVTDTTAVSPDGYSLDNFYLTRPGADDLQLDLFGDYKSNVALYPTFQKYFRTHKPPFLAIWGKNDPFFLPAGAEAFKRDIPGAIVRFVDSGHFALETHAAEIAAAIRDLGAS